MSTNEIIASSRLRRSERLRSRQHAQQDTQRQGSPNLQQHSTAGHQNNLPNTNTVDQLPSANSEVVDEDDLCAICQLMLYRPVITRCKHILCEACMAHWAEVSVTAQMMIVDVDEDPVDFNPVSGLEAGCPMCRTQTSAEPDHARSRELEAKYPLIWRDRKAEDEVEDQSILGVVHTLTLYIGNRHKEVAPSRGSPNMHEWNFFVKPSRNDIIKEVHIELHPTFNPNYKIKRRPPYEIECLGWGTFIITAYVILKAGYSWISDDAENSPSGSPKGMLKLEWTLDFDGYEGRGSMGRCRLKVSDDR